MNRDDLYLIRIKECLDKIILYTAEGKDSFWGDTKTQDAVLRNLQTLAESTQRLSEEVKAAHPGVNWKGIAGFRNVLVHNYLGLNLARVWRIIELELPKLKETIEAILKERL